jgi:hypothetical protein
MPCLKMMFEFSVVPAGASGGWRVQIRFAADHIQYTYGFDARSDATEWLEREADGWIKALQGKM